MSQFLNIDCMEYMKTISDKFFDLAIVDPPYSEKCNLHGVSSKKMTHGWGENWVNSKHEKWNKKPSDFYFSELMRISKNQIIWGGNYFIKNLYDTSCFIIWDKGQRDFSLADAELAWCSFSKPVRIFNFTRAEANKLPRFHPTQKPVDLYLWLLKNYAKPGDKIFDSHVGSGSSLIACEELGFEYIGCELDKDYYQAANERINKYKSQMVLF